MVTSQVFPGRDVQVLPVYIADAEAWKLFNPRARILKIVILFYFQMHWVELDEREKCDSYYSWANRPASPGGLDLAAFS